MLSAEQKDITFPMIAAFFLCSYEILMAQSGNGSLRRYIVAPRSRNAKDRLWVLTAEIGIFQLRKQLQNT